MVSTTWSFAPNTGIASVCFRRADSDPDTPRRFFGNNSFTPPAANRMSRHVFRGCQLRQGMWWTYTVSMGEETEMKRNVHWNGAGRGG